MISVIVPTYNRADTIREAIHSILNQTYQNFELIVIDDGSTDHTDKVISEINDSRILYYKQQNKGASAARNKGIALAKGEYIAFQDSDDYWHKSKMEKQLRTMIETKADVVFCKLKRHNYKIKNNREWPLLKSGFVSFEELVKKPLVSTQTVFAKKKVMKEFLFCESLPALEDYAFSIQASYHNKKFYFMDEVLVDVYLQNDSLTADKMKYIQGNKYILEKYRELFDGNKNILAHRLYVTACLELKEGINSFEMFKKSFLLNKNIKALIRMGFIRVFLKTY